MKARRYLLWVGIAAAVLTACGSVNLGGLGGPGEADGGPGAVDGGPGGAGGSSQGGSGGGSPMQPTGGSPAPAAQGLVLQRASFVDGFEGSDWQCNATLCLRGRITP